MTETAISRRKFFRKSLVIPSEHGSWSWLLVPFLVGTAGLGAAAFTLRAAPRQQAAAVVSVTPEPTPALTPTLAPTPSASALKQDMLGEQTAGMARAHLAGSLGRGYASHSAPWGVRKSPEAPRLTASCRTGVLLPLAL